MRLSHVLSALVATHTTAFQLPDIQSFVSALSITLEDYLSPALLSNETATEEVRKHDLRKRQFSNTCPQNFANCANLGAPGLCCADDAICSADSAGHVACCPSGAACSGTIGGVITQGTVNSIGSLISGTAATGTSSFVNAATTTGGGLVIATTPTATSQTAGQYNPSTSGNGFVIDGTSTVATPGAAVRGAQIPLVARAILRVLEYLPI